MEILFLKLVATPLLILAASLAGRRWGDSVSGWFIGLPLTSGPVCFFLALEQGPGFAAQSAAGCLAGAVAEAAFCLAYGSAACRADWLPALVAGTVAFVATAGLLAMTELALPPLPVLVIAALASALLLMPRSEAAPLALPAAPRWDIPVRMAVATALVFGLTELAPLLGPTVSGLAATYPVFAAVLSAFAHHARGRGAAIGVLRGLLAGLFGFAGFFTVLATAIEPFGIALSFAMATLVASAIQPLSLLALRR